MYIRIKPHDSLFFRDGKPYNRGEDTWANTSLMPNPSVLWGAAASLFMAYGNTIENVEICLKLKKIYLYNEDNNRIYIPAPRDMYYNNNNNMYYEKYIDNDDNHISSLDIPCYVKASTNKKTENTDNFFMDIAFLYKEYYHRYPMVCMVPFSSAALPAYKIGITRDKTTQGSEEGKMYRIDVTQFKKDWSILIDIGTDSLIIPANEGFLKLGGESKAASYKIIGEEPYYIKKYKDASVSINKGNNLSYFKICLTTPALFEKEGWKPENNNSIMLLAASVGKPVYIGGFDMKKKKPKPMYRAVPAGSVYLYTSNGKNTLEQSIKAIECSLYHDKGFGAFEILPFYGS